LTKARATVSSPKGSRLFRHAGAIFLQSNEWYVQVDAGDFGWGGAGHSHADTLSLVAWHRGLPVLTDPGTFTYLADPAARNRFRGTRAHNTICLDGEDQAAAAGPFRWNDKPHVALHAYRGIRHRRRVRLDKGRLLVLDEISGPPGEHSLEQVWNLGAGAPEVHFAFSDPADEVNSEVSPVYGTKTPSSALIVRRKAVLPLAVAMCLDTSSQAVISVPEARQVFHNEGISFPS
jgi:hypothetical protein